MHPALVLYVLSLATSLPGACIQPAMAAENDAALAATVTSDSAQLGSALGTAMQAACSEARPFVVGVRAYGTLPDWFESPALGAALFEQLPGNSIVSRSAVGLFDTDPSSVEDDTIRAAIVMDSLSDLAGGVVLATGLNENNQDEPGRKIGGLSLMAMGGIMVVWGL